MKSVLIKNAKIVNEGSIIESDVLIENGRAEGGVHRCCERGDEPIPELRVFEDKADVQC